MIEITRLRPLPQSHPIRNQPQLEIQMKRTFAAALAVCLFCLTACDKSSTTATTQGTSGTAPTVASTAKPALKIAYSDWPGWVAWDIAIQKGWFKEEGVDVDFSWLEYTPSMDAFTAGKVDAVCMTNGDAMVTGAAGKTSTCIVLNDYSNGNDMIVAAPGIKSLKDLKGQKIGVELNLVDHLLLLKALEANGMSETDVQLVNVPTNDTPQALASGGVKAIAAWQPNSGQALRQVAGSSTLYSSHDAPGLIYDGLYVDKSSLSSRHDDWAKVAKVWFRVVNFIKDEKTKPEALKIMSARVKLTPEQYAPLLEGTFLLDMPGNMKAFTKGDTMESVFGSSAIVNKFNVSKAVYKASQPVEAYLDPSMVTAMSK
jgi:NitT/TauT family transport system substrate-binding protein